MFNKHTDFIVRAPDPFNGGAPLPLLGQNFITPNALFFVRNHAPVPVVAAATYQLTVNGLVETPLKLSLAELQARFPWQEVTATLQCAGNRRQELLSLGDIPAELHWGEEAVSTAMWGGVCLADVLQAAGVQAAAQHIAFLGLDDVLAVAQPFGGSIPRTKALAPEVLLALTMNGEPLPPEHGFPLRVVVPGYLGARSVKWLQTITAQPAPSTNYYQAHAYKLFPGTVTPATVDWAQGYMLGETPLTSVICTPTAGAAVPNRVELKGFAVASSGRAVIRVDVSGDGGQTWTQACLAPASAPWAWGLWHSTLTLPAGPAELVVRAWDSAANTQPERVESVWNFKGYYNNAWHRVRVQVA